MKGPTGVGKTEIARRLAKLVKAPFVKVEATKYTEVGYVGKDVEGMVRDLAECAYRLVKAEKSEEVKAKAMLKQLYHYYMDHIDELPDKLLVMLDNGEDRGRIVCDYISGMTDQYAITKFHEYFVPVAWEIDGY